MPTKILLADDHAIMRAGLRSLLEKEPRLEVVGEARDGRETLEMALKLIPDLVIMDITMPSLNGIDATRRILAELPKVKVAALSMHADEHFVVGMLKAGASAYLLKDSAVEEIGLAVRAVMAGQAYLSSRITGAIVRDYMERLCNPEAPASRGLTPKEREVLQLVAEGNTSKEITLRLNVSVKTVEAHRRQIMDKLGLRTVAELTKYAVRCGITPLER